MNANMQYALDVTIDTIYTDIIEERMMEEPFTNDDLERRFNEWLDAHGLTEDDDILPLCSMICEYQKNSFMAGWQFAKNLLR